MRCDSKQGLEKLKALEALEAWTWIFELGFGLGTPALLFRLHLLFPTSFPASPGVRICTARHLIDCGAVY